MSKGGCCHKGACLRGRGHRSGWGLTCPIPEATAGDKGPTRFEREQLTEGFTASRWAPGMHILLGLAWGWALRDLTRSTYLLPCCPDELKAASLRTSRVLFPLSCSALWLNSNSSHGIVPCHVSILAFRILRGRGEAGRTEMEIFSWKARGIWAVAPAQLRPLGLCQ